MKKFERYWFNAALCILFVDMFSGREDSLLNSAAVVACFVLAVGYFTAMIWIGIKGESQ